jgi:hypothetical protein
LDEAAGIGADARLNTSQRTKAKFEQADESATSGSILGERVLAGFGGEVPGLAIHENLKVFTSPKAPSQAMRQSAGLRQTGLWYVCAAANAEAARAGKVLRKLRINNVTVRVVTR